MSSNLIFLIQWGKKQAQKSHYTSLIKQICSVCDVIYCVTIIIIIIVLVSGILLILRGPQSSHTFLNDVMKGHEQLSHR